jgi:hypothetical protein
LISRRHRGTETESTLTGNRLPTAAILSVRAFVPVRDFAQPPQP